MHVLGLDIGGTKTVACVGDENGRLLSSLRMPTRPEDGPDVCMPRMFDLAHKALNEAGYSLEEVDAVGISAPGPVDLSKGMLNEPPNMKGWVEVPLVRIVEDALGKPVYMNNDANTAALAEYLFGEHHGAESLVYITLSTGLGAGIVVNGRIVQGACDMAGEIGHYVLDPDGPSCPCGLRGCFEAYCGGNAVANRIRKTLGSSDDETCMRKAVGGDLTRLDFKVFADAVKEGDPYAMRWWEEYVERLAQGLGIVMQTLNPNVILLGTIAIHTGPLLLNPLREALPRYAWPACLRATQIAPSSLDTRIGDLGAIAVAVLGHGHSSSE